LVVDWRMTEQDVASMVRTVELLRGDVERSGVGTILYDQRSLPELVRACVPVGGHHIGTTRMTDDPRQGVVDRNCRVHGVDNLYVAGASVFPTCGHANPTLTIVALALRLADHLVAGQSSSVGTRDVAA
jgi:choline dehydrogenase-like flavoprotein